MIGVCRILPFVLVIGCGSTDEPPPTLAVGVPITTLGVGDSLPRITRVAAFAGVRTCPQCPDIETTLLLHPDGSYRLQEHRVDTHTERPVVTLGRWVYEADSVPHLSLHAGREAPRRFALVDPFIARALPALGDTLGTDTPDDFRRITPPPQLNGVARLRGEFRYLADAATLVECASGRQFPVTGDSAFVALQRAYREHSLGALAAIVIDVVGTLAPKPGMEAGSTLETFHVESFSVQRSTAACEASRVTALLAVGDWHLTWLDGESVASTPREHQPTLRFILSEPTMAGNAGCNRFTGRAVLRGLDLAPAPLALTRRACADSLASQHETRYVEILSAGGHFRAEGQDVILAVGGVPRARFVRR